MSANTARTHKVYSVDGGSSGSVTKCGIGYLHGKKVRQALEGLQASYDYRKNMAPKMRNPKRR